MSDRVAVINQGKMLTLESKHTLLENLGKKQLTFHLSKPLKTIPESLSSYTLSLSENKLTFSFKPNSEQNLMDALMAELHRLNILFNDVDTSTTSLEDIFVDMVKKA